jgi:DNA-binding response OmpR family regulator/HPt (histidine-containing phosphotransfer) domain-containing protein
MRILVVEDDECIAKTLENILGNQHYVVDIATDGEIAWELLGAFTYDLILLDVILPKLDGIQLCQRIRSHNYETPVLLLTKQNSSTNKVMGLDAGADDYVVKPFDLPELLARIRVLLRRGKSPLYAVLEWENLRLNFDSCEVTYNSQVLNLTPKEYRLLELFLRNPQKVYSRSEILDHLWSSYDAPKEDTVTAHIKGLRQKLKQAGALDNVIETVYGLGYRLRMSTGGDKLSQPAVETKKLCTVGIESKQEKNNTATGNSGLSTQHLTQTRAALTQLWELLKGTNCDRVTILEQATAAGQENCLNEPLREKAQHAAHKLAGSLGVFGFVKGSRLAEEIEQILQTQQKLHPQQVLHLRDLVVALKQEIQKPAFADLDKVLCDLVVDDGSK